MTKTNQLSFEEIQTAKCIPIEGLLQKLNINPVKLTGNELLYLSPLREEQSPSFSVNSSKNSFIDFGGSQEMKGDVITLASMMWRTDFRTTVRRLLDSYTELTSRFSFSGLTNSPMKSTNPIEIINEARITHPALLKYVRSRHISYSIAHSYLKEVTYVINGKKFFAVGFKNDEGGYELRNGLNFKGGKTKNGVTTFNRGTKTINIFEGFFDFLSALEFYRQSSPSLTTIVLNSCNNVNKALPIIANHSLVNCFLDNDRAGKNTLQAIGKTNIKVKDWSSELYPNSKDFNDFLITTRQ